jgi:glutamate dehydrogenase (NAD(P)+)
MEHLGIPVRKARVVVQGFGNVGSWTARLLNDAGCRVVGVSDSRGAVYNANGLDAQALLDHKQKTGAVSGFNGADAISEKEMLALECEILVPAALEMAITSEVAKDVKARIISEGANGPTTPAADEILQQKDVFVVPDILANSGGVIVSYFEWVQDIQRLFWHEREINRRLEELLDVAFGEVLTTARKEGVPMRTAATMTAVQRIHDATVLRGIYP